MNFCQRLNWNLYHNFWQVKQKKKHTMTQRKHLIVHMYLAKKTNNQFRHLMFCLKVTNNVAINYCSCQSLYDFIQLSLINTTKEPTRLLKKKHDLKNNFVPIKKERIFWIAKYIQIYKDLVTAHQVKTAQCFITICVLLHEIFGKHTYFKSIVILMNWSLYNTYRIK